VWGPFFSNLQKIEKFSMTDLEPVKLDKTGITEFDQLEHVVTGLTQKIIADFQNQKQFSEDISHELQTPLAIISSKLESLLDNSECRDISSSLESVYSSVQRLSKLNKALILISKIENNQFFSGEKSNLKSLFMEKLDEFSELLTLRKLTVETSFDDDFIVPVPPVLAEILVNNLLSNSINHNIQGGKIRMEMSSNHVSLCNTGNHEIAEPEKIFNRFYKANPSGTSVGLGLAIVKKICDIHHLCVDCQFVNNFHCFTLKT